jgi:cell wall-associated NlpC family hydrolase
MGRNVILVIALAGASACATTGAVPRPFPTPGGAPAAAPPPPVARPATPGLPSDAYAISGAALSLRGTPYRNGGSDPSGFDCSGLVWYVFTRYGVQVPRTVSEQFRTGTHVDTADLRAGDLLFFDTAEAAAGAASAHAATHVGISIGGDEFVHAPSSAGEVRVERLGSPYWAPRFIEARRLQ